MNTFKDILDQDASVFLNINEFGSNHKINSNDITIIIDNDRLMERTKKEYDGISVGEVLYFVSASDFGDLPEENTPQTFDGRMMYVFDAREDMGMYEIILRQNRGE